MDAVDQLTAWLSPTLARLKPAARAKLLRHIATGIRRRNMDRIRAQKSPDGASWPARKQRPARRHGIKQKKQMFLKLRQARHFRINKTPEGLAIGFFGRVARIARAHHEGQFDRVSPDGPFYQYPRRELIGFSADDMRWIEQAVAQFLSE
ncbi:MAG: phage virion morphogenesis protein [Gammaproteobacteria bacterium]|nr:phage virion morphogenesis protein [Gammaproteobacteria bacterium]